MISTVAKFTVKQGKETAFLKLINELGEASRAEAGCVEYILHKDVKNSSIYCLIEKWKDQEAVDFHNSTPHFKGIVPKIVALSEAEIDVYKTI